MSLVVAEGFALDTVTIEQAFPANSFNSSMSRKNV